MPLKSFQTMQHKHLTCFKSAKSYMQPVDTNFSALNIYIYVFNLFFASAVYSNLGSLRQLHELCITSPHQSVSERFINVSRLPLLLIFIVVKMFNLY